MAWDNYERLLRLERIAIDLESAVDRNGLELIYLRQKVVDLWRETEAEAGGGVTPGPGTLDVTVFGCNGALLPGASVSITIGVTTYGPVTTDSLGNAHVTGLPATGTGTAVASHSAWSSTVSKPVTVGVATTMSMSSATAQAGTHCSCGCLLPIADTFTYTTGNGTFIPAGTAITMTYRPAFGDWAGSANGNYNGIDSANCAAINFPNPPPVPITGPVVVTLGCGQPSSGSSTFSIGEGIGSCVTGFGQVVRSNGAAVDMTQASGFAVTSFAGVGTYFTGTCSPLSMTGKDTFGTATGATITP